MNWPGNFYPKHIIWVSLLNIGEIENSNISKYTKDPATGEGAM